MVLIISKQKIKKGKVDEFLELVKPLLLGSNNEEGCIEYALYRDQENRNTLTFVEKWKDMDSTVAHTKTEHYLTILPKLKPLLESKELSYHDPV